MQDNPPEEPIDLLADQPAEAPMEDSAHVESAGAEGKIDAEETPETAAKKYTNEDVYTMICLVLRYPSGGHGGETFWTWMMKLYGDTLLEGRNGNGLRNRWRKIIKEHSSNLDEYKKKLAEGFPKEFIENVDKKIAEAVHNLDKIDLSHKAYTCLFPELPLPSSLKDAEKGTRKKKLDDGNAEVVPPVEKKKPKKSSKAGLDLERLLVAQTLDMSKYIQDIDVAGIQAKIALAKNLVIIKDIKENTTAIKNLNEIDQNSEIESLKKLNENLSDFFKGTSGKPSKSPFEWTELEDLILKHPENSDMMNCIIKTHGIDQVDKRKKLLGLI